MKTFTLTFILFFVSFSPKAQIFAPPIEFYHVGNSSSYGGALLGTRSVNSFYTLNKAAGSISNGLSLQKFSNNKLEWSKEIVECFGYDCVGYINIYPTQDDGVLIMRNPRSGLYNSLTRIGADSSKKWEVNFGTKTIENVSATLANGFHVVLKDTNAVTSIRRMKEDGSTAWQINLGNVSITDIKTTTDDGFIITGKNGTRKYSSNGSLEKETLLGGEKILISDFPNVYLIGTQGVAKINLSTGNTIWGYSLSNIEDAKIDAQQSLLLLTGQSLTKLTKNGVVEWTNPSFGGVDLVITPDNDYSIYRVNNEHKVLKVSQNGKLLWDKNFKLPIIRNYSSNLFPASDNGLFLVYSANFVDILVKIANTDTTCSYKSYINTITPKPLECGITLLGSLKKENSYGKTDSLWTDDIRFNWQKNGVDIPHANALSFKVVSSGTYTLKINQGRCSVVSEPLIYKSSGENSTPTISVPDTPLCSGKTISLSASGCNGGTVVWSRVSSDSRSITGIGNTLNIRTDFSNSYLINCMTFVGEEGSLQTCKTSESKIVNINPLIKFYLGINKGRNFLCKDEKLVLRPKNLGGKLPYTYKWFKNEAEITGETKDSLIVNTSGTYKVEVKDAAGCSMVSGAENIFDFAYSQIQLLAEGDREFCTGRSTVLVAKAIGSVDNTYTWFKDGKTIGTLNSLLITNAGTYSLELTENQNHCAVSLPNIVVSEKGGGITAVINPNANIVIYESDSILLTSFQKDGYKYQWYKDGGQISGATKPTLYVRKSGSYVIEIKLADCVVFSSAVNISVEKPLSNESDIQPIEVLMLPNPASDKIKIDLPANVFLRELKIITQYGQEIIKTNQLPPDKQLDLRQLPRAFYEVIISTSKGSITKKLVLE